MPEPPEPVEPTGSRYDELRELIVGPERADLDELRRRVTDPTRRVQDVSQVLPEAVMLHAGRESRLDSALAPIVNDAIKTSVRRDARELGNALFPVMGPAIRKSIAESIRNMVQSFNQAIENSLTIQGISWRFEAMRTGRPFAEVVLLHSLVYRVEQVFLIHRDSGVQLQHAAAEAVATQDPDMVSAMLTAIQDFVRDSFGGGRDETLETFRVGELTVWVEHAGGLVLAVAVRGTPPESLREVLRNALVDIQSTMSGVLQNFAGDTAPFEFIRPQLEDCLRAHYTRGQEKRRSPYFLVAAGVVAVVVGVLLFFGIRDANRAGRLAARLRAEPGILVTSVRRQGPVFVVQGLRDPLARDPLVLATGVGIRPARLRGEWQAYSARVPEFIANRARRLLTAPDAVQFMVRDSVLVITGRAAHAWIKQVQDRVRFVEGVSRLDLTGLHDEELDQAAARIRRLLIRFPVGSAVPRGGQGSTIVQMKADLPGFVRLAEEIGCVPSVTIIGRTDATGEEERNRLLSQERAAAAQAMLIDAGVNPKLITALGVGVSRPVTPETTPEERSYNRSVTFEPVATGIAVAADTLP